MNIKKMVQLSMFTTIALTIFVVESYLPPLAPIPGIKLGLANTITLIVLALWGWKEGLLVLFLRILLGSMLTGNVISCCFSLGGGFLCFLIMSLLKHIVPQKMLWLLSVIGAVFHNIGQLLVACIVLGSSSVFWYFPILLTSGIVTGIFTGVAAQYVVIKFGNLFREKRREM